MRKFAGFMVLIAITLLLGACSSRHFVQVPIDDEGGYYLAESGSATAVYPAAPFWYGSGSSWAMSPYAWAISPRLPASNWYGGTWYYSPNFYPHYFGTTNQWVFNSYPASFHCSGPCTPYSDPFRQLLYPRVPGDSTVIPQPVNHVTRLRHDEGMRRVERMLRERSAMRDRHRFTTFNSLPDVRSSSHRVSSRSGLSSSRSTGRSTGTTVSSRSSASTRTDASVRDY